MAFLVLSIAAAQAQSYRVSSSAGANVRKGPGTEHPVMGTIPEGASVKVVERTNDKWVKVDYNGQTGYVSSELISDKNNTSSKNSGNNNNNNTAAKKNTSSANSRNSNNSGNHNNTRNQAGSTNKNMGIGLRFGDPAGITFKKYNGNTAWEFNLGNSFAGYYGYNRYNRYYNDRFYRDYSSSNYELKSYGRSAYTTSFQAHWLKHHDFPGVNNLQFYYGVGPQVRFNRVWYRYKSKIDGRDYYDTYNDIDLGIDGVLGLEYTFREVPLSIFLDANIFVEVFDVPGWLYGQSGIGIRYNF